MNLQRGFRASSRYVFGFPLDISPLLFQAASVFPLKKNQPACSCVHLVVSFVRLSICSSFYWTLTPRRLTWARLASRGSLCLPDVVAKNFLFFFIFQQHKKVFHGLLFVQKACCDIAFLSFFFESKIIPARLIFSSSCTNPWNKNIEKWCIHKREQKVFFFVAFSLFPFILTPSTSSASLRLNSYHFNFSSNGLFFRTQRKKALSFSHFHSEPGAFFLKAHV